MSEKKWGQTVLGWFIVQDEKPAGADEYQPFADTAPADAETPVSEAAAAALPSFSGNLPPAVNGQVDFPAVYEAAGVDSDEQGRVQKALDLLKSLPAGTDEAVKRQIVLASLKAFGVPIEGIIEAGVSEIQALEGYIRAGASDTQKLIEESDQRIRQYEDEVRSLRKVMQQRVEEQQSAVKVCNDKKLEIQQILEFFGREEVERVVKASPKLVDPQDPPRVGA